MGWILSDDGWKDLQRNCLMSGLSSWRPIVKCLNFDNCRNVMVLRLVNVIVEDRVLNPSPVI